MPASDLTALARGRSPDDRRRLLLGIAALCEATPPGAEASPVLGDIFMIIARQAERDIRMALSDSLARAEWAPPALIAMLALDEIEIARPVIAQSPLLKDQDLLRVLIEATVEHQIEVARRPHISGRVADAIIDRAEPASLTALAGNRTADISEDALRRLVEHSRRIAALRAPLTRHPRLNDALAAELYRWVGDALRQAISERFRIDDPRLTDSVSRATVDAASPGQIPRLAHDPGNTDVDEMERRLVTKLQHAGQLRAGFLIRAVREKRLSLFEHALAALGGFPVSQIRASIHSDSPEALFLACAAVGIDRAVFPAVLDEIRTLSDGLPGAGDESYLTRTTVTPAAAVREFRSLMSRLTA